MILPLVSSISTELLSLWIAYPFRMRKCRIHSDLIWRSGSWIRLWYMLRGWDCKGRGRIDVPIFVVEQFLKTSESTIYEWLRTGRERGGFYRYKVRKGHLRVYLAGLHHLCESLNLEDWGATSIVDIGFIARLRTIKREAVKATADRGQYASITQQRYALKDIERKYYKPVFPDHIFEQVDRGSSAKPGRGTIPCLLWIGPRKLFVSAGFLPFGKKQESMAYDLGISTDTVQRHLQGRERRQICQTKSAYRQVADVFKYHPEGFPEREIRPATYFSINSDGVGQLRETVGQSSMRLRRTLKPSRIFEYGGRFWIYHPNVYRPTSCLTSMARSRRNFKTHVEHRKWDESYVRLIIEILRGARQGLRLTIRESYLRGGLLRAFEKFFFSEGPGKEPQNP